MRAECQYWGMDQETKDKIHDRYIEADFWLKHHWKPILWAIVFFWICFGWLWDDSSDDHDTPYSSFYYECSNDPYGCR